MINLLLLFLPLTFGTKYLLYDVGIGEGFNLRRDVHIRMAHLVLHLRKTEDWQLVLPPWHHVVHWGEGEARPWKTFFDVEEMKKIVPCIEFFDLFKGKKITIDHTLALSPLRETYKEGGYEQFRFGIVPTTCSDSPLYDAAAGYAFAFRKHETVWQPTLLYENEKINVKEVHCFKIMGSSLYLAKELQQLNGKYFLVDQAKQTTHHCMNHDYGADFWRIRQSMKYAPDLVSEAKTFEEKYLSKRFVAIHLRRGDFLSAHPSETPPLKKIAKQVKSAMNKFPKEERKEMKIFVATDASETEVATIKKHLKNAVLFRDSGRGVNMAPGQLVVIDQIISSHAALFIGTEYSTVTYRIQEDRELLGHPTDSTYSVFCNNPSPCQASIRSPPPLKPSATSSYDYQDRCYSSYIIDADEKIKTEL